MFRNLATLVLYIGILFYKIKIPAVILLPYTFFMLIGDSYEYYPKNIQKMLYPIWFFFENMGPIGYNIEFLPIVFLSAYIFIKTLINI